MSEGQAPPPPPNVPPPTEPPPPEPPSAVPPSAVPPSNVATRPQFDFGKPFTYVFDDPRWLNKILIGGLFYLAGFFLIGWFFILGYVVVSWIMALIKLQALLTIRKQRWLTRQVAVENGQVVRTASAAEGAAPADLPPAGQRGPVAPVHGAPVPDRRVPAHAGSARGVPAGSRQPGRGGPPRGMPGPGSAGGPGPDDTVPIVRVSA